MDDSWRRSTKPLSLPGGIHMPYSWTVGRVGSRFLIELRDNARIMASRCSPCDLVWVPPRRRCPLCFKEMGEKDWLEVGPEGTVRHFTIVHYEFPEMAFKPPFAYGIIDLDGADAGITHFIYGGELSNLRSGARVKPLMALDPKGSILDILYFTINGG